MFKLLIAAALSTTQAVIPQEGCVTRQQFGDMLVVMAPYFIDGLRAGCAPHLDPSAFLRSDAAADMAARFRRAGEGRVVETFRAFLQSRGQAAERIDRGTVEAAMGSGVVTQILGTLDRAKCRDFNEIAETVSAMSPDQAGRFMGAVLSMRQRDTRRTSSSSRLRLCTE